ncbi:MAG: PEP-CTERM sorting domain-containing protein [Moorea sp. SIO2B7]|nr:PEP-CTERM sorting domain-containing protein [Moorena sp. SIO2B7]
MNNNISTALSTMKNSVSTLVGSSVLAAGIAIAATMPAQAFVLNTQLTGDPRPGNPDELFVDVTITSGEAGVAANQAKFIVDINSPLHSNIKLDDFFFNIGSYTTSEVSLVSGSSTPSAWTVFGNGTNANGSGGADFAFSIDRTGGNPSGNVTNSTDLEFIVQLNSGNFALSDFLNADVSTSNDALLGSGQMGVHLQSLNTAVGGASSDSGFAMGSNNAAVPEPTTMGGFILAGGILSQLRRKKSNKDSE